MQQVISKNDRILKGVNSIPPGGYSHKKLGASFHQVQKGRGEETVALNTYRKTDEPFGSESRLWLTHSVWPKCLKIMSPRAREVMVGIYTHTSFRAHPTINSGDKGLNINFTLRTYLNQQQLLQKKLVLCRHKAVAPVLGLVYSPDVHGVWE